MQNALCWQCFLLAWYDNMTYKIDEATSPSKHQSAEPEVI